MVRSGWWIIVICICFSTWTPSLSDNLSSMESPIPVLFHLSWHSHSVTCWVLYFHVSSAPEFLTFSLTGFVCLFVCFWWVKVCLLGLLPCWVSVPIASSVYVPVLHSGRQRTLTSLCSLLLGSGCVGNPLSFCWFSQGDEEVLLFTLWQGSTFTPLPSPGELNIRLYHWVCMDCCWK